MLNSLTSVWDRSQYLETPHPTVKRRSHMTIGMTTGRRTGRHTDRRYRSHMTTGVQTGVPTDRRYVHT